MLWQALFHAVLFSELTGTGREHSVYILGMLLFWHQTRAAMRCASQMDLDTIRTSEQFMGDTII